LFHSRAQSPDYSKYPVYTGTDLGINYSPQRSIFKIWAPTAEAAELKLYHAGSGNNSVGTFPMVKAGKGVWEVTVYTDQQNKFYTFRVKIKGKWSDEVTDPYVKAVGVNGKRGAVVDLKATNPAGWDKDRSPVLKNPVDAVIYELHVRDASIDKSSGNRSGSYP
jgi:pullulanase